MLKHDYKHQERAGAAMDKKVEESVDLHVRVARPGEMGLGERGVDVQC